jgi:hypothetical protein
MTTVRELTGESSSARRVTSATVLLVAVVVLVGIAFTSGVLAADITNTDRTVTNTSVAPGETVTVEVVVDVNGDLGPTETVQVTDEFSPAFGDATFNDSDPQVGGAGSNEDNTEFIAVWNENADNYTVSYDVTVPADASGGDQFEISGTAEVGDNSQELPTATLTVEGGGICTYTNSEGVVETSGLRGAINDWRSGDISTSLLRDVIDAWRTGDPVSGC